jgi:dCMP deaminase
MKNRQWDRYFYGIALTVASQSKCLSRQIGAVLVRDKIVICTGYNGPPRGMAHCGETFIQCPRRMAGYSSGEGLHLCPATHAEQNCIAQAARLGIRVKGSTMYLTCEVPCKTCLGLIINSGISEIVCTSLTHYDSVTSNILKHSNIRLRKYED